MTPTDELRRLLDERGVEHYDHENGEPLRDLSEAGPDPATSWRIGDASVCAVPDSKGTFDIWIDHATPEQAIAATLGSEDTYTREDVEGAFVSGYSLGLDMFDSSKPEKGWNQNERSMEEEMEDLGWVRKDAATLGSGTCELINAADDLGKGTSSCMCCSCGYTALDDWWDEFKYCPNCGKRIVVVTS